MLSGCSGSVNYGEFSFVDFLFSGSVNYGEFSLVDFLLSGSVSYGECSFVDLLLSGFDCFVCSISICSSEPRIAFDFCGEFYEMVSLPILLSTLNYNSVPLNTYLF